MDSKNALQNHHPGFISNGMKKTLFLLFAFLFLCLGQISYAVAQTGDSNRFVPLAPIPGLTDGGVANSANLPDFFNNLYKLLVGASAILAIIMIIWGGFEISTQDSISKHANGKERITQAIFGLIIVLSPVLVFSIINPRILNLSVSLPPLRTPPVTRAPNLNNLPQGIGPQNLFICELIAGLPDCRPQINRCAGNEMSNTLVCATGAGVIDQQRTVDVSLSGGYTCGDNNYYAYVICQ